MRVVKLSETAQRSADFLSKADAAKLFQITSMLSDFMLPLQRAGMVSESDYFGMDGWRFFDQRYPFLIFFEITSDPTTEREGILIRQILRV